MNEAERTADGRLLCWIFGGADRNLFRRCSECLVAELGAQPTERFDAPDQIFLDLIVAGAPIVLQWTAGRGIALGINAAQAEHEALLARIAAFVAQRVVPPNQ